MAGLAMLFARDGAPVPRSHFDRLFAALDHRGPHGRGASHLPAASLGWQHFHTTPEDRQATVGEQPPPPLADPSGRFHFLFDGRLDDRAEVIRALGGSGKSSDGRPPSDAELAFEAVLAWGEGAVARLLGPAAWVLFDLEASRALLGRDALGDRTLFYHLSPRRLLVASEEEALLASPGVSGQIHEPSLARFFAGEAPAPGETFFTEIRELPPGSVLTVDRERDDLHQAWSPEVGPRLFYRDEDEYAEHFRELLSAAVRCRLRAEAPAAVLMSGGLDSTAVAALAAREEPAWRGGGDLLTFSWVFDEIPGADERSWIEPMSLHHGLTSIHLPGDDGWPLADLPTWPVFTAAPFQGAYRRLVERACAAARQRGVSVLLTGDYGDHLYSGAIHWFGDLLAEGRAGDALRCLAGEIRSGLGAACGLPPRGAVSRALGWPGRRPPLPEWLTPHARAVLAASGHSTAPPAPFRRRPGLQNLASPLAARAITLEISHAVRVPLEVRRPYRDRRLIEYCLALPAHQLYRPGWGKWILRRAMRGILPEAVRLRRQSTSLMGLFARGLLEREADTIETFLGQEARLWPRYVERKWLHSVYPEWVKQHRDGKELAALWLCLCAELWIHQMGSPYGKSSESEEGGGMRWSCQR